MTTGDPIRVRFADGREFPADLGDSILDVALRHGVALDHACGGVCACSTCHVRIEAGADALSPATEDEEDQLDEARDVGLDSRLGCQARVVARPAGGSIGVRIPAWNVNLVREGGD
ncbi:MAG: 2Fe-2S iron-sulfur cluster binding domain-containing protein [Planctomycetes bacterium]|nr:2Fe-2S iron-sulfur cluster binding domain-containing protein [Planctomycetota bacterium]